MSENSGRRRPLPVAAPLFDGNERAYVLECVESTWVSSIGPFIARFEQEFAGYCGVTHGIACSNGTTALHLALLGLGIGPGDEVIVPSLSYVATANAVRHCGAEPVFVDSDQVTWNLDPTLLDPLVTERTKAIIVVHLYGRPAPMDAVNAFARRHGLRVIEDAAEAHGAAYRGRRVGSLADVAAFSFFGNKIITCGEGGMVLTDDDEIAARVRQLKGQGQDPQRRYWFPIVGYNYRMTNVQAAIGLAQLERLDAFLHARAEIARWYRECLVETAAVVLPAPATDDETPVNWLFSVVLRVESAQAREAVMTKLRQQGIDTRPFFPAIHQLPPYVSFRGPADPSVAEWLGSRGVSLPTWVGMTREDVERAGDALRTAVKTMAPKLPTEARSDAPHELRSVGARVR